MNAAEFLLAHGAPSAQPAFVWDGGSVTRPALAEAVRQAAGTFAAEGVGMGDRVLLLLDDSPELVVAYLGALWLGAVPIAFNPRAPAADIAMVVSDSAPKLALTEPDAPAGALRAIRGRDAVARFLAAGTPMTSAAPVRAEDPAFFVYTSGTTGRLKAAVHRHGDVRLAGRYPVETLGLGAGDRLFATSKLFFAYALGLVLFGSLRIGATGVLFSGRATPEAVLGVLERHRPTAVFSVPTAYRAMLAAGVVADGVFRDVRRYVSAGERLPPQIHERWRAATGVEPLDGMGTSETIFMLLANPHGASCPGASGVPAPGAEVRLLDAEGRPASPGEPGILWARIDSCAAGYWNRPELSQRLFRGGWFMTGDLYRIDDGGHWHHLGRSDDMLKLAGQWVSPAEVEEAAIAAGAGDAALVGETDRDGLLRAVLFVVPGPQGHDGLSMALAKVLPSYKRPKEIRAVAEIPRTATGKIQRYKLRATLG